MQHERCGARTRQGTPCKTAPVRGATRCRMHGGSSPQAERAAAWRLAERRVRASLAEEGVTPVGDPFEAFRRVVAEAVALKRFAAAHVAALGSDLTGYDRDDREYLRAVLTLYERAMDRAGRLLHEWVKLDMDERLVRVTERHAELILQVIRATLRELGHELDEVEVAAVVRRHLRLVEP